MPSRVRLVQRHSQNLLLVHVVWATAGRLPLLGLSADAWLAEALGRKAYEVGCALVACGNAADHVHVLIRYPSTVRLAEVVQRLKGGSGYDWNAMGRSPRLSWQPGYCAESFGHADLLPVVRYVEQQRAHHDNADPHEPWQAVLSQDSAEPDAFFTRRTKSAEPADT